MRISLINIVRCLRIEFVPIIQIQTTLHLLGNFIGILQIASTIVLQERSYYTLTDGWKLLVAHALFQNALEIRYIL